MNNHLAYRRQFLLSRNSIEALRDWKRLQLEPFQLHVHPDLQVTEAQDSDKRIVLLGFIYDPQHYQSDNQTILDGILSSTHDFDGLIQALKPLTGRYAILYRDKRSFNLIQDALALREVYYCKGDNDVVCGSQPNLLVHFSKPRIKASTDPLVVDFVENHLPLVRNGRLWPGDGTPYDDIKHLLPNHYLDLKRMASFRYWPNTPIGKMHIEEAIPKCAAFLQGAIKGAAHRDPLMMAVTAGEDSRALLAASREISGDIYYFINRHDRHSDTSGDIYIPQELFKRIGLPFHVHRYPKEVPQEFKDHFLNNTALSHESLMPAIYNIYYQQHPEKLNILGVGEVGRTKFFDEPKKLQPYYLAYMLRFRNCPYAVNECESWLKAAKPVARQHGLNIMTLFWWEVLIGNWGAVGNSESDIAIEEFDPYASHHLYEMFLSLDERYKTFKDNILFQELIKYMWPELLDVPINPPDGMKDRLVSLLHKVGLEQKLRAYKARLYESRYYAKAQKP